MSAEYVLRRLLLAGRDTVPEIWTRTRFFDDVLCPRINALDCNLGWLLRGNKDCLWKDCNLTQRDTNLGAFGHRGLEDEIDDVAGGSTKRERWADEMHGRYLWGRRSRLQSDGSS